MTEELRGGATPTRFPNSDERDTPRTDALSKVWEKDDHGVTKYAAMYLLARDLERDLETCRDAHMANCLAADTLRTEIRALREQLSARSETGPLLPGLRKAHELCMKELTDVDSRCRSDKPTPDDAIRNCLDEIEGAMRKCQ